jgi:hypothetical protein
MRVSFGLENDEIEIEQFITILKQAAPISNHEAHQFDAFKENMAAFCKSRVEAVFPT